MQKLAHRNPSLAMALAVAALLATSAGAAARTAGEPQEAQAAASVRRGVPHVTGTVTRWTGNRIDLKTPDGKVLKVAVNQGTKRLVEVKDGAEVTVEYRRKISGFVIADRVLPAEEGARAAGKAPGPATGAVAGRVVSWNSTALLLRTAEGDVTLFLSPSTEILVKPLSADLPVTVEYREGADRARVATRVLAAGPTGDVTASKESGSE